MNQMFFKTLPDELVLHLRMTLSMNDYVYWCEPEKGYPNELFHGYVNHKLFDSEAKVDWIEYNNERYALLCEDDDGAYIAGLSPTNPVIRVEETQLHQLLRGESIRNEKS